MKRQVLAVLLLVSLVSLAYGLNYMYFSHHELTRFGDRIKFWHGDTLAGPIRTNTCFAFMQDPSLEDWVIMGCDSGGDYPDNFVVGAPELPLPEQAAWVRAQALAEDRFFSGGDSLWARVRLGDHAFRLWWTLAGLPFDTNNFTVHELPDTATLFFDCPRVNLFGRMHSVLVLGTSGMIGLEDNVLYASADSLTGYAPAGHTEKLAVIAEGEIKVLNTVANGRQNSSGGGYGQTNPNYTSIVLDGIYVALGESFTFEQQNDPDSGYVCIPCGCNPNGIGGGPDDRGTIYLYGGLAQYRRGYVHRSTCTSTGYLKWYRFDPAIKHWNLHLFENLRENELAPASVAFGEVAVGDTAAQIVTLANDFVPANPSGFHTAAPFHVELLPDSDDWTAQLRVQFIPVAPGEFTGTLTLPVEDYDDTLRVPLSGTATSTGADERPALLPASASLAAAPNPFNAVTLLRFDLPASGHITLTLFDLTGRQVATLADGAFTAGTHRVTLAGADLASGIYWVRLNTADHIIALKLALIK